MGGESMRILVAGGAGFIGSHYVRTLLDGGYPDYGHAHVTVLDKLTYAGSLANLEPVAASPRFSFVRGDIGNAELLDSVIPGHDVVVNFVAENHVDRSIAGASNFTTANVAGVQVLLQACLDAGVSRVVQVSTDEVYGSMPSRSWAEDARLDPSSLCSAAKAGGDLLAGAYARVHALNVSITRSCANYGPYQYPEKEIPLFVTNLLDGLKLPLHGDGLNVRGWVHVDDHCQGIQLVLEKGEPGRVYHISGDAEISDVELIQALLDCCGAGWEMVTRSEGGHGPVGRYSLDDSLLRSMGYAPQIPFSMGLKATVEWYRENRRWWEAQKQSRSGPVDRATAEPQAINEAATRRASLVRRRSSPRLRKIK
jgi:dTDP-glucose 4,6-dehydratase